MSLKLFHQETFKRAFHHSSYIMLECFQVAESFCICQFFEVLRHSLLFVLFKIASNFVSLKTWWWRKNIGAVTKFGKWMKRNIIVDARFMKTFLSAKLQSKTTVNFNEVFVRIAISWFDVEDSHNLQDCKMGPYSWCFCNSK